MMESKMNRRKGGQPSNLNALKHGFYARKLKASDVKDVNNYEFPGLNDEISLFRVQIRRVSEMGDNIKTLDDATSYLRAMSHAFGQLARLVRTQYYISGGKGQWEELLGQAINETLAELQAQGDPENTSHPKNVSKEGRAIPKEKAVGAENYPIQNE